MRSTLLFLVFAASAAVAVAQPGRAGGARGPCAAASGASAPAAGCTGPGGGPGPRWGRDNTPGWPMMNREERRMHHERMASIKTYDECRAYMDQHHQQMTERAKERGRAAPGQPRRDACLPLKPKADSAR